MKTTIKLALLYFLMQILGSLAALPFGFVYIYVTQGILDPQAVQECILGPAMLLGILFMGAYLWKRGYLTDDERLYDPISAAFEGWTLLAGVACIFLVSVLTEQLSFLPDLMKPAFDHLQREWLGILCIALLGPILEEMLFRGAITKVLLRHYSPTTAILISGIVFGLVHINPAQVTGACLSGFLFAWLYYKTGSLVPGILIHVLNNSLALYIRLFWPEADDLSQLMDTPTLLLYTVAALAVLAMAIRQIERYKA